MYCIVLFYIIILYLVKCDNTKISTIRYFFDFRYKKLSVILYTTFNFKRYLFITKKF